MKITFLGAAKTVTGSCYKVDTSDLSFLVDCGQFQGVNEEQNNTPEFEFDPKKIDFMLLTHAHIDHSGRIPLLTKNGFTGKIFCTRPTSDLCSLLLKDSAHIHEEDAIWDNKKRQRAGLPLIEPLYSIDDAYVALQYFYPVNYDKKIEINDNISVRFNEAGHLLGSSFIEIWIKEDNETKKIVFSGDLGSSGNALLNPLKPLSNSDYLVIESTYGNRIHENIDLRMKQLINAIDKTIEKGGTIIIPSFAIGRTQEVIYELKEYYIKNYGIKKFLEIPIYIDSPLAINSTKVFKENHIYLKESISKKYDQGQDPLSFKNIRYLESIKASSKLNHSSEPKVIISASGMCDAGRIQHHLKHYLWKPTTTVIFIGYQGIGTLGREILNGFDNVEILDETIKVNAQIYSISGFSGHADKNMLLDWTNHIEDLKKIIIVHGESDSQNELKNELEKQKNVDIIIPKLFDEVIL
ncbi:MBL fold metallo-hydrolase RNA specificity domain-containing protein [Helicovermis profundi]|uniref:MBL fold metallo-hydrolase n=1 Tax=Helicovermis profundi TaxID=3065157 RepID=A0AAU9ERP7_9FIRM|nr:MBL fold metallo-hydrolase [Clostridia bacterium S502]